MHSSKEQAGALHKAKSGRWMLNNIELTAGSHFQIFLQGHWIDVTIEHDSGGYYAIPLAVRLHSGLRARFPSEWGD